MKTTILHILEANKGHHISGETIANQLHMTRANVWKEIQKLKEQGMQIESVRNLGYKLVDYVNNLSKSYILDHVLDLSDVKIFETVTSTNTVAKEHAATENLLIVANEQSQGKGRMGRNFFSPNKEGVYMSLVLKPKVELDDVQLSTICAALAVCLALESLYELKPKIKWLNDIYLDDKKVCGILTEGEIELELNRFRYLVVGIGINTHFSNLLPDDLNDIYTAIGGSVDRNQLITSVINNFYELYNNLPENRYALIEAYKLRSNVLGKSLTVSNKGDQSFYAEDISLKGHLVVIDENGMRHELNSGEVSVRGQFNEN